MQKHIKNIGLILLMQCGYGYSSIPSRVPSLITIKQVVNLVGLRNFLKTHGFIDIQKHDDPYSLHMKKAYEREYVLSEAKKQFLQYTKEDKVKVQQCPRGYFVQTLKSSGEKIFDEIVIVRNEHGASIASIPQLPSEVNSHVKLDSSLVSDLDKVVKLIKCFID